MKRAALGLGVLAVLGLALIMLNSGAHGVVEDYHGADNVAALQATIDRESRDRLLLVMYQAPWCGYCCRLTGQARDNSHLVSYDYRMLRVNVDHYPVLSDYFQSQDGIPETHIYLGGEHIDTMLGSTPGPAHFAAYMNALGENYAGYLAVRAAAYP